jgi:glutamyl-tRNA synthetase
LGYEAHTHYRHIPPILNNNDISLEALLKEGFLPDAIINYLLLLGYENAPQEIFTLPQAIAWFELENISQSSVEIDLDKLSFINAEHLKMMDDKALSSLFGFADEDIGKLAKVYLEECSTTQALQDRISAIFTHKSFEGKWGKEMQLLASLIQEAPMIRSYEDFEAYLIKNSKLKNEAFFMPLRLLLTGTDQGPKLPKIYPLIKSYLLEVAS